MKKTLLLIITILMTVALVTSCTSNPNNTPQPSQPGGQQTQVPAGTPDVSAFIGEEKAKEIALQKAGIAADGVIFDRVELDRDNGVWHYEVEFRQDRTEYDADIKADDGTIISFETDFDD